MKAILGIFSAISLLAIVFAARPIDGVRKAIRDEEFRDRLLRQIDEGHLEAIKNKKSYKKFHDEWNSVENEPFRALETACSNFTKNNNDLGEHISNKETREELLEEVRKAVKALPERPHIPRSRLLEKLRDAPTKQKVYAVNAVALAQQIWDKWAYELYLNYLLELPVDHQQRQVFNELLDFDLIYDPRGIADKLFEKAYVNRLVRKYN